ncbi:porin family protein [Lutibacter sp.]|uniref:porin family protein n=1 Tax=Lutibacter sp. TaxID=1925666 RepID=UPI002737746A|nr:porin family protein [Lutibacter sp.]MDP3313597.1 porin family protein [Lutibacter sp.]
MKNCVFVIISFFLIQNSFSQEVSDSIGIYYLEDQLYVSFHYNLIESAPKTLKSNGFSGGFSTGFVRDIPLNEDRNFGFGIGLGYVYSVFIQNLKIQNEDGNSIFSIVEDFSTNKLSYSALEIPVEMRWRTSDIKKYKFWRIYGGFKGYYVLQSNYKFVDENIKIKSKNISEIEKWSYGLTLSAGHGHWNLYLYYGLKPILKNVLNTNEGFHLREMNIGLKFYIM